MDKQWSQLVKYATLRGVDLNEVEFPYGYRRKTASLRVLWLRYAEAMHPTYRLQVFACLVAIGGRAGIGSAWRTRIFGTIKSPSWASLMGRSFHQDQRFASGIEACCAIDAVVTNPGKTHRAPKTVRVLGGWANEFDDQLGPHGLHANIGTPGVKGYESWHWQPANIDGWATWDKAGRPDPAGWTIPTPPPIGDMTVELVKFDPIDKPAPLFAVAGDLFAVHVTAAQWGAMIAAGGFDTGDIVEHDRADAKQWTLIGRAPDGYGAIWGNSGWV